MGSRSRDRGGGGVLGARWLSLPRFAILTAVLCNATGKRGRELA